MCTCVCMGVYACICVCVQTCVCVCVCAYVCVCFLYEGLRVGGRGSLVSPLVMRLGGWGEGGFSS